MDHELGDVRVQEATEEMATKCSKAELWGEPKIQNMSLTVSTIYCPGMLVIGVEL